MAIAESTFTAERVRAWFAGNGITISEWARLHEFQPDLVYGVLSGRLRGRRGQAHRIAVALGLKRTMTGSPCDLDSRLDLSRHEARPSWSDAEPFPDSGSGSTLTGRLKLPRQSSQDPKTEKEAS